MSNQYILSLPEILENIFGHLDNKDLFNILAVNHTWRSERFRAICKLYEFNLNIRYNCFNIMLSNFRENFLKSRLKIIYSQANTNKDLHFNFASLVYSHCVSASSN